MKKTMMIALIILGMTVPSFADLTGLDFKYNLLTGSYNGTNQFTASAVAASDGNVKRDVPVLGNAIFAVGSALFSTNLSVTSVTLTHADAAGTMVMTDLDGTTLNLNVKGDFVPVGSTVFFNGTINSAVFGGHNDGTFNGNTGSFSTTFVPSLGAGSVTQLSLNAPWLSLGSFTNEQTNVTGIITVVPAPAALVLGGLGLALVGWIKRRSS